MKHSHVTKNTCATRIDFEVDDQQKVHNVKFNGGCTGNTSAISALVEGRSTEEVVSLLQGIKCRGGTSCPDQLAQALIKINENKN